MPNTDAATLAGSNSHWCATAVNISPVKATKCRRSIQSASTTDASAATAPEAFQGWFNP
ncbi:MAG: hypothetical protein ACRDTA_01405 [Pseudonocardiaceae bacterium]